MKTTAEAWADLCTACRELRAAVVEALRPRRPTGPPTVPQPHVGPDVTGEAPFPGAAVYAFPPQNRLVPGRCHGNVHQFATRDGLCQCGEQAWPEENPGA